MSDHILTVTQLNYSVRHTLETQLGSVWLTGEISNLAVPVSGHWYLTLKDDKSQVRCAMFRGSNMRVKFKPQNGMNVLVRANVSLYEPRGDYQLIIETMQPAGDGLLQQRFDELKMKLAAEGLFALERKRQLPPFVKKVGVITSSTGAALQDILHILQRRDPSLAVLIYPTMVQGASAAADIAATIDLANERDECDVLIVGRGGGSLEDLWCFNEEIVARAIFRSHIPIISAVGHETDVTIADFVADVRAPTPSAAAELVSQDRSVLQQRLNYFSERLFLAFDRLWNEKLRHFSQLSHRLQTQHPERQLQQQIRRIEQLSARAVAALQLNMTRKQHRWQLLQSKLPHLHPKQQLQRQTQHLAQLNQRATAQIERLLQGKLQQQQRLVQRVEKLPLSHDIHRQQVYLTQIETKIAYLLERQWLQAQQRWQMLCAKLDGLSPLKILARGYSVTQANGHIVTQAAQLKIGDQLTTTLQQGEVVSEVVKIKRV